MRARLAAAIAGVLWVAATSHAATGADDPRAGEQWNLASIGATDAWAHSKGAGVTIGIVDSGIDATHPDLAGKIDALATCLGGPCREGAAPDSAGHGTIVAGIAAAATANGVGIAGVAPDARLVVAKALNDRGAGDTEDINNAIRWVVDKGADVVNLSLGDASVVLTARLGSPLAPAIEYAWTRGAIPVLAAGNYQVLGGGGSANYGNLDAVVVGATTKAGAVAWYSTPLGNAKWGVVAPGGSDDKLATGVLSTAAGGRYEWAAGTSMAAPHVSGALALLLSQGRSATAAVEHLLATLDTTVPCGEGCRGRLRAATAVAPVTASGAAAAAPAPNRQEERGTRPRVSPGSSALAVLLVVSVGVGYAVLRSRSRGRAGGHAGAAGARRDGC